MTTTTNLDIQLINTLAYEYHQAVIREKAAKELKDTLRVALLEAIGSTKSVTTPDYKVTQSHRTPAWRLQETLLLENGVDPDVIQASKKQDKPSSPSIKVTPARV